MGWACGTRGTGDKLIEGLGWKTWRKEATWKTYG